MNNGTNPIRAKHLESAANVAKNFLAAQISDVTAAISSDLVNLNGMTLSTTQPTVNGALWYQLVDGEPQLRIHYGGHDYSLDNSPGLTVTLNNGSEISYGTPCTATVTYRGSGVLTVSVSDSGVTPAYSDGTITIPWAAVTGSITITVSIAADGTYIAEEKSFTVSMRQDNPELTITPAASTLNLAGTTASVTRNGSGAISVVSDNANVTPTISGSTITIPYAVFDEDTNVTFSVSVAADSGYAGDTKTFTVTYVSPLVVNMPFDTSTTQDLRGNTWTTSGSPTIQDGALYLNGSSYLKMTETFAFTGQPFTISCICSGTSNSTGGAVALWQMYIGSTNRLQMGITTAGKLQMWKDTDSTMNVVSSAGVYDGHEHHVECVYDGTKFYCFLDGNLSGLKAHTWSARNYALYVGTNYSTNRKFTGYIDDFKVYDGVALHTANFTPPARSST